MDKKKEIINKIISKLKSQKSDDAFNTYATDQNIAFFESLKNIFSYLKWLFFKASKIDSSRLLEVNDILPEYDESMHKKLIEMEKKEFPGLIKPLVNKILDFIKKENKDLILINLGSGGREVDRQVIDKLTKENIKNQIIFVGVDKSDWAHKLAEENLSNLKQYISIINIENLDQKILSEIKQREKDKKFIIINCKNNIFELDKIFPEKYFNLVYHSLFKHHLNQTEKEKLDEVCNSIAKLTFEYDGFRSWIGMIPQTIIGWNNLIFLNAEIFSNLRFRKKSEIKKENPDAGFSRIGYYLISKY